jgi:hypothetical protein
MISSAHASDMFDKVMSNLSFVHLDTRNSVTRIISYPGMGNGRSDNPDCLVMLAETERFVSERVEKFLALAQELKVTNGRGHVFNQPDFNQELVAEVLHGHVVYKLTDLGTYLTGFQVRSKSNESFSQIIARNFDHKVGSIIMQFSRGCQMIDAASRD